MRRFFLPTSSAVLVAAYFLAPSGWFRAPGPVASAKTPVAASEQSDPFNTDAAWYYRQGQVKHWRMLVIQH